MNTSKPDLPSARDSEETSYLSRRTISKVTRFHDCGIPCFQSVPELFLMNANAPSVLHLTSPSCSERLWVGGGHPVQRYRVCKVPCTVFCIRNLELGVQGQFRLPLVVACGESIALQRSNQLANAERCRLAGTKRSS